MKRTAIITALIVGAMLAAVAVTAQSPGGRQRPGPATRPDLLEPPGPPDGPGEGQGRGPGEGPGEGPTRGPGRRPGGVFRHGSGGPDLMRIEREYAAELREARKEIGELRRKLEQNGTQLRSLWDKGLQADSEEERAKLRPKFEKLFGERAELELKIAQRHYAMAQKGFDIAVQRLVEAKVALREAKIKQGRRKEWFKRDWGPRLRQRRGERRGGNGASAEERPPEESSGE